MAYPFNQFDTRTPPATEGYVPSFLSKLPFGRRSSKGATSGYRKPSETQHTLEALEPRVLLAADLSFGAATDLTLKYDGVDTFQLVDELDAVVDSAVRDAGDDRVSITSTTDVSGDSTLAFDLASLLSGENISFTGLGLGTDTLSVLSDDDMTLTDAQLNVGAKSFTIANFDAAQLTGGASANTLDASAFSGDVTLTGEGDDDILIGGAGNDTYVFGDNWGTDTLTDGGGTDRLDFSGHSSTLNVSTDKTSITSSDTSVVNQAIPVEEVDIAIDLDLKNALDAGLTNLVSFINRLETGASAVSQLINTLPLLSSDAVDASASKVSQMRDIFDDFQLQVAGLSAPKFSDLVSEMNSLTLPVQAELDSFSLTATGNYRGADTSGQLEVLVDLEIDTENSATFDFDLGEDAGLLGIDFGAATVAIDADVDADLSLGLSTDPAPVFFIADGGTLDVDVSASVTLPAINLNIGFLELGIPENIITYGGTVQIELIEGTGPIDGRILGTELDSASFEDFFNVNLVGTNLDADIAVTIPNGVQIAGVDLSAATFDLTLPSSDDIFNGLLPEVSLKSGADDLLDFSNLGSNEVLGMLEQLVNTLTSMAQNEAMQVAVPFTDFTVGDLLDYATAFKSSVIDPLFVSGNALEADADGDGQPDFTFESIQELMFVLSGFVSVATAQFNPTNRELRINLDFNRALGFGAAKVGSAQEGGGGNNEIQDVEINAIASGGTLTDTFKLGFTDSSGRVELTDTIAFNASAGTVQTRLEALDGIGAGNVDVIVNADGDVFRVEFIGALADTNLAVMVSDATQLKGEFPMDFGVELGDLAGVTTSADFSMEALLDLDLTFGIDLSPSTTIELTGPVFNPQNMADVLISQPDDAAETDFSTQIIRIDNATDGTFTLSFNGGAASGDLAYNISEGALETAIQNLTGIATATISATDPVIELGDRVFEVSVTFDVPANATLLTADPSGLKGAADGILSNTANFDFNLINQAITVEKSTGNPDVAGSTTILTDGDASFVSDGVEVGDIIVNSTDGSTAVVVTVDSETQITHSVLTGGTLNDWQLADDYQVSLEIPEVNLGNFDINVNRNTGNTSFDDLIEDVQEQVNIALVNAATPVTLGFLDGSTLSTGVLGVLGTDTADGDPLTTLRDDIKFTLNLVVDGEDEEVTGSLRVVDILDITPADPDDQLSITELAVPVTDGELATGLQSAINVALDAAGFGGFDVTVDTDGGKLRVTVDAAGDPADTLELVFQSPVQVEGGGGRISLVSPETKLSSNLLEPGVTVGHRLEVFADYENPAFQELGLLSSPTRFDGVTNEEIQFALEVDGTPVDVSLAAGVHGGSVAGLAADLQSAINTGLINASLAVDAATAEALVEVFLVDDEGNRIGLRGGSGVEKLTLDIPKLGGAEPTGAITELGFASGDGQPQRSIATKFFVEDVSLTGGVALDASSVELVANIGFLEITASGSGNLTATADLSFVNPLDGGTRIDSDVLSSALLDGKFIYNAADQGGTTDDPGTGFLDPTLSGGLDINLEVEPTGALAGLPGDLDASLQFTLQSPDWFTVAPSLNDPLGFGTDLIEFAGATVFTLGAAPTEALDSDVTFTISNDGGTTEALGFINADDTAGFTTAAEYRTALQTAVNNALTELGGGTITVGLDGSENLTLNGDTGLSFRSNFTFSGPDIDSILDQFKDLSFDDIIAGLRFVIDFLRSLDGSDGEDAVAGPLDFKMPLIDRSIADLLDFASDLGERIELIAANPQGSIQALEDALKEQLGLRVGQTNILSFDTSTGVLGIDFGFEASAGVARSLNLDIADALDAAGAPAFLSSVVTANASGQLTGTAGVDLDLKFGLDLTGDDKALFLRTGADGTKFTASAAAALENPFFELGLGPFSVFSQGGTARLDGSFEVELIDTDGGSDERLDLIILDASPSIILPTAANVDVTITGDAVVNLPLFTGTPDNPISIDTDDTDSKTNALNISISSLDDLFNDVSGAFDVTLPDLDLFLTPPDLFLLLSNPSLIVSGLDKVLLTLEQGIQGQIFDFEIPLVGKALADNPAANFINDFRSEFLQPLARTLVENNVTLGAVDGTSGEGDGLIGLIQDTLFSTFGADGLGLLKDSGNGMGITKADIVHSGADLNTILSQDFIQFDFSIGQTKVIELADVDFDFGLPGLSIAADFTPTLTLDWMLDFGFGVDKELGFYFVAKDDPADPELSLSVTLDLGSELGPDATAQGQLAFLALNLTDGVNIDDDADLEFTELVLTGAVDLVEPSGDERLTVTELVAGPIGDIFQASLTGDADIRMHAVVDFGAIDPSLSEVLPSVSTDILAHFGLTLTPADGLVIDPPAVAFLDVTLDVGSFISDFAGPILGEIGDVLDNVDFLVGPDGFLNKRIPLISDLAGKTITGKDLVKIFDPKNGPSVVAVLDAIDELFFFIDLVTGAAEEANGSSIMINFGDLMLTNPGNFFDGLTIGGAPLLDSVLDLGLPDLSAKSVKAADTSGAPTPTTPLPKKTSRFVSGVTSEGSLQFNLFEPATVFKLILGQEVTLFTYELPEFGFDFFYRQQFPIFGPLVATFGGGVSANFDFGFGYDTRGLNQFLATDNPAFLLNGFFLNDLDPATGFDRAEVTLKAQLAVGAAISLGIAKAGVEGGIEATIDFNLADLDQDGKIRFDELAGNLAANSFIPLAIFDISGQMDFFLRAFLEINLLFVKIKKEFEFLRLTLFEFNIPFKRPAILASQSGDVLTLNIGDNAGSRLNGDLRDIAETINVKTNGPGEVVVWSSQFFVNETIAGTNPFVGVKKIVAFGGAGNDVINLMGVEDTGIEVEIHGGDGDDMITGGMGSDLLFGDGGMDVIAGREGDDTIDGGLGIDNLSGGLDNDTILGGFGNDLLFGNEGNDTLDGGPGDDTLDGGTGDDFYDLETAGSLDVIGGGGGGLDALDFSDKFENISFFLRDGQALAGWGTRTGTFTNSLNTAGLGDWLEDFEHMVVAGSLSEISAVFGGFGSDTFHIYETRNDAVVTLLDGKASDDTYIFYAEDGSPVDVYISENGNNWDLNNQIEVLGTDLAEEITVTSSDITVENAAMLLAGVNQTIRYESPEVDENFLRIKVKSFGGDDVVNVESTSITVPVKVFAGTGDDTLTVGDGAVNNINAVSRPGLEQPFGLGPLVLLGEEGHDTIIIDDSGDSDGGDTGYLTSFLETRPGDIQVEVGVVNDLGMTLNELVSSEIANDEFVLPGAPVDLTYTLEEAATTVFVDIVNEDGTIVNIISGTTTGGLNTVAFDGTDFLTDPLAAGNYSYKIRAFNVTPGRVEFENFEAVDVRLGLGGDELRVGVEDIFDQLSLNRQDIFDEFTYTIDGMTTVSGGGGVDTIKVETTRTLDRDALNTDLEIVSAVTTTQTNGPGVNEIQEFTVGADVGFFTLKFRFMETGPIALDATGADVKAALEKLFIIGENSVDVDRIGDTFVVEFVNDLGETDVAQLEARVTPLTIFGDDGGDKLVVEAINQDMFFQGGGGGDFVQLNVDTDTLAPLTSNGVNAEVNLDGGNESDTYNVGLIGGATNSLINVFDSGGPGTDVLNVNGTVNPDLFLLRAAAAQSGLAFVALLNTEPDVERVNYNTNLESINIFSKEGDDEFYIDDTRAAITIFAGDNNDFFQVGQLFKSQRTTDQAGVASEDVFATIETTRGFLSNGISAPMTINAGDGDDEFIVFHNKAVLTVNGDGGNDRFLVQAFALVGSQEDERERTDISGGDEADFIAYAVNAPVAINGGDGFDTVIVVGTEFSDDFVITENGVFGAGINVNFVNVEEVEVSGAEGDDRFFILGTGETFSTRVVGDLGGDSFFVNGETPANGVISNDLLGHSGILSHDVVSSDTDSLYNGLKAVGISANVADNEEPAIIINQSNGDSQVVEGGAFDSYTVVLSRSPRPGTRVKVTTLPPEGLVFVEADGVTEILKDDGLTPDGVELKFNETTWNVEQTVRFKAILDGEVEGNLTAAIQHKVSTFEEVIEPVFETQDVIENVPIYAFVPVFTTINLGFLGSISILVGIEKVQIGSFPVVVGTQQVQVGTIGEEVTASDAFTGVAEEAIGQKSDVRVLTPTGGDSGTAIDEVQEITVNPAVGSFTLRFGLEDTDPIGFADSDADVQGKLEDIEGIGAGNVNVTRALDIDGNAVFTITFTGDLAATNVQELVARVGATLRDDQGAFPTGLTDATRPEGLRGSFVTIIDDPGNPESVGQTRLILSNTETTLTLDQAWDALPSNQARYEIQQFNGLVIPNVEVIVEDADSAALVVLQSGSETVVAEGSLSGTDTIDISLSMALAVGEVVTVNLDGFGQMDFSGADVMTSGGSTFLEFNEFNYDTVQQITVAAVDDGVVEGFHRADITLTTSSSQGGSGYDGVEKTLVANIGDNDYAGVLIKDSNGSTSVVEGGDLPSFIGQGTDEYTIALTKAPDVGEVVTVTVTAQPTRTSRTGSIAGHPDAVRSFTEQLEVSLDGVSYFTSLDVTFDLDGTLATQWDTEQTILVRAIDDAIVDGGDTKVFAEGLDLLNNIQGPLFIVGGQGEDRTGLLEREPIMLPGEFNIKSSLGDVVSGAEGGPNNTPPATVNINPNDLDEVEILNLIGRATPADIVAGDLLDLTLEITEGPAKNKVGIVKDVTIISATEWELSLDRLWERTFSGNTEVPDATSKFTLTKTNPNLLVDETSQVDTLVIDDTDNVNSFDDPALPIGTENSFAVGRMFFDDEFEVLEDSVLTTLDKLRITGLGMGVDRTIGGVLQPGGITNEGIEFVQLDLGAGNNKFDVSDTVFRDDGFQTWTFINTGGGDDLITVDIDSGEDGLLALNTQGGDDTVLAGDSTLPLYIFGGDGDDNITDGENNDIIFGDNGRVDFQDDNGKIITRLGTAPEQIINTVSTGTSDASLVDDTADFPVGDLALTGLLVKITDGTGINQTRLITGNTATQLTLDAAWDTALDTTSEYTIFTTPVVPTDGVVHEINFAQTIDPDIGGADTIFINNGMDIVFGGAEGDTVQTGGTDNIQDVVLGDHGLATFNGSETFDAGEETSILSFNFNASRPDRTVTGEAGAGAARAGNWNNLDGDGPLAFGDESGEVIVFDDGGIAPGVTIEWGRDIDTDPIKLKNDAHSQIDAVIGTEDDRLFEGYLHANDNHTVGVNISGLAGHFESYDVYVYLDADDSNSQSGSSVRAITDGSTTYYLDDADGNTFTGTYIQVDSTDPLLPQAGNYVVFQGLTGDVASIRIDDDITLSSSKKNRPAINAVQVVGQSYAIDRIESIDPEFGGDDTIRMGGLGTDIVIGGQGDDTIESFGPPVHSDFDTDIVVGDSARATFMLGELRQIVTTSPDSGGDDTIRIDNNEDIVLGGIGDDNIDTGAENESFDNGDVTILSVNFNSEVDKGVVTGVAGAVQVGNWNNLTGRNPQTLGNGADEIVILDDGQIASGVTVKWGGDLDSNNKVALNEDSHDQIVNPDTQNERLFEGYLDTGLNKTLGVNINGLDAHFSGSYDVYVYLDVDDEKSSPGNSIRKISDGTTTYYLNDPDGNTFTGEFVEVTSIDPKAAGIGNYVVFRNVSGDLFSVRIDSVGSGVPNRSAITALQIIGGTDKDNIVTGGDFDRDTVVGDNGVARFFGGELYEVFTTDPTEGGNDTILTGEDADVVLGGSGDDTIDGEGGHDLLLGDNARIILFEGEVVGLNLSDPIESNDKNFDPYGIFGVQLQDFETGGNDTLSGGTDDDLMYGQAGNDTFAFAGLGLGFDRAVEADGLGSLPNDLHDGLDFSAFGGPVKIILGRSSTQQVTSGSFQGDINLRLKLFSKTVFEDVTGSDFKDKIKGINRSGVLIGRDGDDLIKAGSGGNTIDGGEGNDKIRSGKGNDTIVGGTGDDNIRSKKGDNTIDGGDGNDKIRSGKGNDTIVGGLGDDNIRSKKGDNTIDGGDGNDKIKSGKGNDTITGGAGDDNIRSSKGDNIIDGGEGNDKIKSGKGNDTIDGGLGDDNIRSKKGDNIIDGGEGNDTIKSGKGNDTIDGGLGDDNIRSKKGDNTIDGGDGNDIIHGGKGNDTITGGDGDDFINGGPGDDIIDGGLGVDILIGGPGVNIITDPDAMLAQSAGEFMATPTVTHGQLEKIFNAAIARWAGVRFIDQARLATLDDLEWTLTDMAGLTLGQSTGNRIDIDADAAGHGWFVDETPGSNEEFTLSRNGWVAKPNSAASGKMDLLTVVSHEVGHYLGLDHENSTSDFSVMNDTLQSGYRYMGEGTLLSSAFFAAGSALLEEMVGLTKESENEESASENTSALIFDEASGTFFDGKSEATSDYDGWYIDEGESGSDEDVYTLVSLDDGDVTSLSDNENSGHRGSRIDWNTKFAG